MRGARAPSPAKAKATALGATGHVDTVLVGALIVLASFGTLVMFSASYAVGIRDYSDGLYFIRRQFARFQHADNAIRSFPIA